MLYRENFIILWKHCLLEGGARVDFNSDEKEFIESYELKTDDIILLTSGGTDLKIQLIM